MQKTIKRTLSALLCLCLVLSLFAGLGFTADAATSKNTGVRHETCAALSEQALDYYTGEYDWDTLSLLDGVETDSSLAAMDGELYNALNELMSDTMTNSVTYKNLINYWTSTDASANGGQILFYSDVESTSNVNREHVWPKSRASFYQKNGGSDLHHLRPTNSNVNSTRSNYTMGDVVGVYSGYKTYQYDGKNVLYYLPSADIVEVNDNIKGDVARILLYVYVRWEQPNLCENVASGNLPAFDSDDSANNGLAVIKNLDTLLEWCAEDPVDTWEMSRNDCIENIQGNRNVFIDYPEYAWLIFGREVPADLVTPSGEGGNMTSYEISAVSDDISHGLVTVDGYKVTAIPADGYVVKSAEVIPSTAATITRDGNVFRLSNVTADCTVKVCFERAATITVSFSAPETIAPISVQQGKSITLPDCTATVEGYSFVGWTTSEITAETDVKPTVYAAGAEFTPLNDTTLYALYSRTEQSGTVGGNATLVTASPDDWSGTYVIAVTTKSGDVMMSNVAGSGTYLTPDSAIVSGDTVTNAAERNYFTLEKYGDYYAIKSSDGKYVKSGGVKSLSMGTEFSADNSAYLWSVSTDGIAHSNSANGSLRYNASSPRFTTYLDSSNQMDVSLYLLGKASTDYYLTVGETTTPDPDPTPTPTPTPDPDPTPTPTPDPDPTPTPTPDPTPTPTPTPTPDPDPTPLANPFTDVKDTAVYYDAVLWAYYHEPQITKGVTDTEFMPDDSCVRGQVVTFLWRASGCPEPKGDCPFTDVSENSVYYKAIIWAAEQGITTGFYDGTFRPNDPVSRAQFVTFLWRAEGKPDTSLTKNIFNDVSEKSPYYPAILWAYENGVTQGYGGNLFKPDMTCTRWHVVLFMQRCLDK